MNLFSLYRKESIHPYCDKVKKDPLETECTDSRDSVALCNLVEYTKELPSIFQVRRNKYFVMRNFKKNF